MNTKEFIEQVISGDLGKNDVLEFASHVKRDYNGDIQALADDLFLLAHGALLYGRTQAVSDWTEIDRLEKAASVISEAYGLDSMTASEPGTDPEQEAEEKRSANDQFSTNKSTEEIESIFNNLKEAGFIDGLTLLAQWRAVCGFTKRGDTPKINWTGKQVELTNFVHELWGSNSDYWEKTVNCFLVNGSKQKAKTLSSSFQKPESNKNRVALLSSIIKGTYTSST